MSVMMIVFEHERQIAQKVIPNPNGTILNKIIRMDNFTIKFLLYTLAPLAILVLCDEFK